MPSSTASKLLYLLPALICALALSLPALAGGAAPGQGLSGQDWIRGQILIQPRAGVSEQRLQGLIAAAGGQEQGRIPGIGVRIINVPPRAEEAVMRALSRNPNIKFVERDHLIPLEEIPNDPRYNNAWHLPKIDANLAWRQSKGDGVVVAILDTGIDAGHPDMQGKLVAGWNAVDRSAADITDINGHGTRVAGTVGGATDNGIGVAAVGWNAMIMPIRVSNRSDGVASSSDMARGLTWAADNGADVANMSYASWRHATVASAAQYMRNRGGLVFGSAGNNGADMGYAPSPHTIVVAATNSSDNNPGWSNHGAYVDLSAPGAGIQTTSRGGGYSSVSGTSFSSPIAAAVAALVLAADRNLTPAEVEQILYDSADDLGAAGWDPHYGWGRVNAGHAVAMAAGPGPVIDSEPPQVAFLSPQAGDVLDSDGLLVVEVGASDNVGVTRVDLYANGQWVGSETAAAWEFVIDLDQLPEGSLQLEAEAHDAAGNVGVATVDVVIERAPVEPVDVEAPVVAILEPIAGAVVDGVVLIEVGASDNVGVTRVDLYAGGHLVGSATEAPYHFFWDTEAEADGPVTLSAEAFDAAGNRGTSGVEVVVEQPPPPPSPDPQPEPEPEPEPQPDPAPAPIVDEPVAPPVVEILSPTPGTSVNGSARVSVRASGEAAIASIRVRINDQPLCNGHGASLECDWITGDFASGDYAVIATAEDVAGNTDVMSVGVSLVGVESSAGDGTGVGSVGADDSGGGGAGFPIGFVPPGRRKP